MVLWILQLLLLQLADANIFDALKGSNCGHTARHCYTFDIANPAAGATRIADNALIPNPKQSSFLLIQDNAEWKVHVDCGSLTKCTFFIGSHEITKGETNRVKIEEKGMDAGANVLGYTLKSALGREHIGDLLELYKGEQTMKVTGESGGKTVEFKISDNKKPIVNYAKKCPANSLSKPVPEAKDAMYDHTNVFTCYPTPRFGEIFVGAAGSGKSKVYCSMGGLRDEDGNVVSTDKDTKPSCWNSLPILEMFGNCADKSKNLCLGFKTKNGATGLKEITAKPSDNNRGAYLDMTDKQKWILTLTWPTMGFSNCKFQVKGGAKTLEFACDLDKDQPHKDDEMKITVTKVAVGMDGVDWQSQFEIVSDVSDEPVLDVLQWYNGQAVQLTFTKDDGAFTAADNVVVTVPECKDKVDEPPLDTIFKENAKKLDYNKQNTYSCPTSEAPENKLIFFNEENTGQATVFCSKRGWRKSDHTFYKPNTDQTVFCYTDSPESVLKFTFFKDYCAQEAQQDRCFPVDNDDNPTKLVYTAKTTPTAKRGVDLDRTQAGKWIVTLAYKPDASNVCAFSIGTQLKINCGQSATSAPQNFPPANSKVTVKVVKVQDDDPSIKYEQYSIEPIAADEYVSDALGLYVNRDFTLSLQIGPTTILSENEVKLSPDCTAKAGAIHDKATSEEPIGIDNLYKCSDPNNKLIFLDGNNMKTNEVYCSERGWRKKADGSFLLARSAQTIVSCYTDDPPKPLPIFTDCNAMDCYVYSDSVYVLNVVTVIPPASKDLLGLELDRRIGNKWIVTLAYERGTTDQTCKFAIGSANFACGKAVNEEYQVNKATVKCLEKGTGKKDKSLTYEKYSIEAPAGNENSVIDALQLYKEAKQPVMITTQKTVPNAPVESVIFPECTPEGPVDPARQFQKDGNKFSCPGVIYDFVFLGDVNANVKEVYCSEKGWRDENGKKIGELAKAISCYSDNPPKSLSMFDDCDKKLCYAIDAGTPKKLVLPKQIPAFKKNEALGINLDKSSEKEWFVTAAHAKDAAPKFVLGGLAFDLEQAAGWTKAFEKVTVKLVDSGTDGKPNQIRYKKFSITPIDANEPVADALKLYEKDEYKLILKTTGGTDIESEGVEFVEACAARTEPASEELTKKPKEATQNRNKFSCTQKLKKFVYIGAQKVDSDHIFCSERGWRKKDGTFHAENKGERPYCYTDEPNTQLTMMDKCNEPKRACYTYDDMTSTLNRINDNAAKKLDHPLGLDFDFSNDQSWTLTISYDKDSLDEMSFEFPQSRLTAVSVGGKPVSAQETINGVIVKYVEEGKDGSIIFQKFTIVPEKIDNNIDSIIDALRLYEKADFDIQLTFKENDAPKVYTTTQKLMFLEDKCKGGNHQFELGTPHSPQKAFNEYRCVAPSLNPEWKYIFLDNKFVGGEVAYCSKMGWRNDQHKLIQPFADETPYCYTLCETKFMGSDKEVKDKDGKVVKPTAAPSTLNFQCLAGKASIKVGTDYYTTVKCANNKWSGDRADNGVMEDIPTTFDKKYKFDAHCFGAFMFLHENCDTEAKKKDGCLQPKLDFNQVLTCDTGFSLTYEGNIYKTMKIVNGDWKDEADKKIGPADISKKPMCLSKCKPGNVDTANPAGDLTEETDKATYSWDEATNVGTLKCATETDILIFSVDGSEKDYFNALTCDGKANKWKNGNSDKKDLGPIAKSDDLKVKAHCYKACAAQKVVDNCQQEEDCKKGTFTGEKLSCDANHVLFVNTIERPKDLKCTAKGWTEEGAMNILTGLDYGVDKGVKLDVKCIDKCGSTFRANDKQGVKYDGKKMTCDGTRMISYKIGDSSAKSTLDDLECESAVGWKGGANILINFANGYKFTAACINSCTPSLIDSQCNARPQCEAPKMQADSITCPNPWQVMKRRSEPKVLEYKDILCLKKSFKFSDDTMSVSRAGPDMKLDVDCISKCDADFVKISTVGTNTDPTNTLTQTKPTNSDKKHTLECKDSFHYTKFSDGSKDHYTEKVFECDPEKGWSAADVASEAGDGVFAKFEGDKHVAKAEVACFDFCAKRIVDDECPPHLLQSDCKKVDYDGQKKIFSCGKQHTMNFAGKDLLVTDSDFAEDRDGLKCTPEGYKRMGVKADEFILKFGITETDTTAKVYCYNNCHKDNVQTKTVQDFIKPPTGHDQGSLKCEAQDLLVIETANSPQPTRVIDDATCKADVGWTSGTGPQKKTIVDFKTDVKLTAYCHKVCVADINFVDDCDTSKDPKNMCDKLTYKNMKLTCDKHYRAFMDVTRDDSNVAKYEETGPLECSRSGWKATESGATFKHDFTDKAVKLDQKLHVICKHKCHRDFIEDSCVTTTGTCTKVDYDGEKMSCNHPSEILVIEFKENAGAILQVRESFKNATCDDSGWKMYATDADDAPAVQFAASPTNTNYNIRARCEQICHPNTLTATEANSRTYKLDDVLTCSSETEKLEFKDKSGNTISYADLRCSKKGWTDGDKQNIPFTAGAGTMRQFDAKCTNNPCMRKRKFETGEEEPCEEVVNGQKEINYGCMPDFTEKYSAKCPKTMALVRYGKGFNTGDQPLVLPNLTCVNGDWVKPADGSKVIANDVAVNDLVCRAENCAKCGEILATSLCSDSNCRQMTFRKGHGLQCSQYRCVSGAHYWIETIKDGKTVRTYYPGKGENGEYRAIKCNEAPEYTTPDGMTRVNDDSTVGCVEQIPCHEHVSLNTTCAGLTVQCDTDDLTGHLAKAWIKTSSMGPTPFVTCNNGMSLFRETEAGKWSGLAKLQCNGVGSWDVYKSETPDDKEEKPLALKNTRVVCAKENPEIIVPPPPTTTLKPSPCSYCELPANLPCDDCENDFSNVKTEEKDGKCELISNTGRFMINERGTESYKNEQIFCNEATKKWQRADGTEITKLSVIGKKAIDVFDGINAGGIAGIVVAVVLVLAAITGIVVFMYVHKKREKARLETLKSKGLETKNDSIIDNLSTIDEPKTLIL